MRQKAGTPGMDRTSCAGICDSPCARHGASGLYRGKYISILSGPEHGNVLYRIAPEGAGGGGKAHRQPDPGDRGRYLQRGHQTAYGRTGQAEDQTERRFESGKTAGGSGPEERAYPLFPAQVCGHGLYRRSLPEATDKNLCECGIRLRR